MLQSSNDLLYCKKPTDVGTEADVLSTILNSIAISCSFNPSAGISFTNV